MKKGQAAIFDGIMFLLLSSFSIAMMFAFLSDYGNSQAKMLRSSHSLNYVQGIGKALYSLDASMLKDVQLADAPITCSELEKFRSNTVTDLLKRDISDGKFDNKYGESDVANAPGKLALRCALAELMKPVVGSGFDYHAEVLDGKSNFKPFALDPGDPEQLLVTNLPVSDVLYEEAGKGCNFVSSTLKGKQLLAISTPFRVIEEGSLDRKIDHQLRICMWPSERI